MKKLGLGLLLIIVEVMFTTGITGCDNGTTGTTVIEYTVTFDANGGQVSPGTETVEEGKTLSSLPTPTKASGDAIFQGWYTKNGADNDWGKVFTTITPVSDDITVYAKWGSTEPTKFIVTFDPNEGTVNPTSIQINSGDSVGALPIPEKNNNVFDGWWTSLNDSGTPFVNTTSVIDNITVYAKWITIASGQKVISITGLSSYSDNRIRVMLTSKETPPIMNDDIVIGFNNSQGGASIPGEGNVVLPLYFANEGAFDQPWTGSGSYFVSVTIQQSNDSKLNFLSKQQYQFTSTTTEIQFTTSNFTQWELE
jgi:uncharacterized repeat protein (TIGR02543 family)